MALKDDHIRWILDVEATGVQANLQSLTSSTVKLTKENQAWKKEIKDIEKQLRSTEREMEKLIKAKKEDSKQMKVLKEIQHGAKIELDDYNKKVAQNTKTINENHKKHSDLIKTMKLEDMTMTQLRQRAKELQGQMNHTSASLSPESHKKLGKELDAVNKRMGVVGNTNKSLLQQFAGMHHPVGTAAKAVQGFGQALKVLIANPIGIIIMAIVAAFQALKVAIQGSDEARTKLEGGMNALKSVLDTLKRTITEVFGALKNLVTLDFKALKQNAKNIVDINKNLVENAKAAYDATIAQDALNDVIARNNDLTKVNEARIAQLRQISMDTTKSVKERMQASKELMELEQKNYKMAVSNIKGQYDVFAGVNKNLIDEMKRANSTEFTAVEKYLEMIESGIELTFEQRTELSNLVNDITTNTDRASEEQKEQFRSFFSDLSTQQYEYFQKSRRDQMNASRIKTEGIKQTSKLELELTQALIDAETNAYNERLKAAGIFNKEKSTLTQSEWAERIKIESDYQKKLTIIAEEAEKQRFKKSKTDAGLDGDPTKLTADQNKALEVLQAQHEAQMQQIKDSGKKTQLNIQKEADTAILKAIQEAGNAELSALNAIESAKITKLKQEHVDRVKTQIQYENELKQIQDQALTDRLWSQENYLATLKAITNPTEEQKTAILASEEAIRQTQNQINDRKIQDEKAHQDRRLAIRQQYGLVSIAESYAFELKALEEAHAAELLSEEEFQQAKLQMKLQYGQEYAGQAQQMIGAVSDVVNAMQDAETQKVKTNYEEQHTALKAKLDQGIISEDEYNSQKEALNYEQKEKELDVEKKFADAQFALKVAEIGASLAMGIMSAWATSMELGAIAGPIAAGVLTGLLTTTAAFQVKAANDQRKAVKELTLEASSSNSSTQTTGRVVLNDGYADGGFNAAETGGYTGDGDRYEYAGTFANGKDFHRGEYIVAQPEMKNPTLMNHVRAIERVRLRRTNKNPLPDGFSDGGYNDHRRKSGRSSVVETTLEQSIDKFDRAVDKFEKTRVRGDWNIHEFKQAESDYENSNNLGQR